MSRNGFYHLSPEASYRITVYGEMSPNVLDYFEGMRIETVYTKAGKINTVLSGKVKDQSALMGVLNTLYDFQYFISSVQCSEENKLGGWGC